MVSSVSTSDSFLFLSYIEELKRQLLKKIKPNFVKFKISVGRRGGREVTKSDTKEYGYRRLNEHKSQEQLQRASFIEHVIACSLFTLPLRSVADPSLDNLYSLFLI